MKEIVYSKSPGIPHGSMDEEFHEGRYRKLAANVAAGEVFKKKKSVKWHCTNCDYIHVNNTANIWPCLRCFHRRAGYATSSIYDRT